MKNSSKPVDFRRHPGDNSSTKRHSDKKGFVRRPGSKTSSNRAIRKRLSKCSSRPYVTGEEQEIELGLIDNF